jgi:rhodanese-related sulfurtransferase
MSRLGLRQDWSRIAVLVVGSFVLAQGLLAWDPLSPALEVYGAEQAGHGAGRKFTYITAREAERAAMRNEVLLLDVRNRADYEEAHAQGAQSGSFREFETDMVKGLRFDQTGLGKLLSNGQYRSAIVYTYDADSPLAVEAVDEIDCRTNWPNLGIIYGGFDEWQADGLPVRAGGQP